MIYLEKNPVLAMYRARKDSPLLCDRLVIPIKEGTKILIRKEWPHDEWIEGIYSMRKWPIDHDDYDESAGYLYLDRFTYQEKWSPILVDDEVRIIF